MIHLPASSLLSAFPHTTSSLLFQISPSTARPNLVPQLVLRPLQDWSRQTASITSPASGHSQEVPGLSSGPLTTGRIPLSPLCVTPSHVLSLPPKKTTGFPNLASMILYLDTIQTSSFYTLFLPYWSSSIYKPDAKPLDSNFESSSSQHGSHFLLWMTMPPTKKTMSAPRLLG